MWPVETWVACASNLYDGAGNVTLIGRLPSNYLPNGATKAFKCPFTGHFALFMRSLEPPRVADLNVTVTAHASTDNATAQAAVPRPLSANLGHDRFFCFPRAGFNEKTRGWNSLPES